MLAIFNLIAPCVFDLDLPYHIFDWVIYKSQAAMCESYTSGDRVAFNAEPVSNGLSGYPDSLIINDCDFDVSR